MKGQKKLKLVLINFLSNPDIEILDWSLENETVDEQLNTNPWLWKKETGKKLLKITTTNVRTNS
jgi:hypothetical protein